MPLQLHGNGRIGKNRGQDIYGLKFNETISTRALCKTVGMSRQNHYKQIKARTRREIDEELIGQQVKKKDLRRNLWVDLFKIRHNLLKTLKIAR